MQQRDAESVSAIPPIEGSVNDQEDCLVCGCPMIKTKTGWYCRKCRKTGPPRMRGHCRNKGCGVYAVLNGKGLCFVCERKKGLSGVSGPLSLVLSVEAKEKAPALE